MEETITAFILSRNRGLYLWACLDSLYKYTRFPHRFILGDNGSDDPVVSSVIRGFERRGMFHDTLLRDRNDPDLLETMLKRHSEELGNFFAFIESDVMVFDQDPCWLGTMVGLMAADPKLAMLGSLLDQSDFVSPESVSTAELPKEQLDFLVKAASPERLFVKNGEEILYCSRKGPPNPPGRIVLYRTAILRELFGLEVRHLTDRQFSQEFIKAGYKTGVAANVRHRHLSLLNYFDYPEYDKAQRDWYFKTRTAEHRGNL